MVDPNLAVITWLQQSTALNGLVGSNIYSPYLPEGFSAQTGQSAVVVRARGGKPSPEITVLIEPSMAIEAWSMEAPAAKAIYAVVHDLMHGANNVNLGSAGVIVVSQEEVPGQDILDPETHWAAVIAYYSLLLHAPGV